MRTVSEDIGDVVCDPDRAQDDENHDLKVQEPGHREASTGPEPSDPHDPESKADSNERPNSCTELLEKIE